MPSDIRRSTVGAVSSVVTKGTTPTTLGHAFQSEGVNFVKVESISADGRFLREKMVKISPEANSELSRSQLSVDDILFTIAGTIGRTAIVTPDILPANTNQAVAIVRPRKDLVIPRFLLYSLANPRFVRSALRNTVESVQANFSLGELKAAEIVLPPLSEQRSVVEVLGSLDNRIDLLRQAISTCESIAGALFKSWFIDFDAVRAKSEGRDPEGMSADVAARFPSEFVDSELGPIPEGWSVGSLADIVDFQNGYAFKSRDWEDSGYPVVKIGDVKPGIIDLTGCSFVSAETVAGLERFRLNRGDLLVGMTGYVGETGLVPGGDPPAYLNQRVGRFLAKNGGRWFGYVYCAVRDSAFKEYAELQSHGSAQANVSGSSLLVYPCVIPPHEILSSFDALIRSMVDSILSNHEMAIATSSLRDLLLPRLLSGAIKVA